MVSRIEKFKYIHNSLPIYDTKISQGSWWGSRFFARWGLRSLSKEERMFRLTLIGLLVKVKKNLRDFENNFAIKDPYESLKTAKEIVSWGESYVNLIINEFDYFLRSQDAKKSQDYDKKDEIGTDQGVDTTRTDEKIQPPSGSKKKTDSKKPPSKVQEAPTFDKSVKEKIEFIYNDCNWGDKLSDLLLGFLNDPQRVSVYRDKIKKILFKAIKFLGLIDDKSVSDDKKNELKSEIFNGYNILLNIANHCSNQNKDSFEEIYNAIKNKQTSALSFNNIEKVSHNVLTRWLRKKILSQSDNLADQNRVKAIDYIKEVADKIDPLLNMLESKDKSIEEILDNFRDINTLLIRSLANIRVFVNNYYYLFNKDKDKKKSLNITERRSLVRDIGDLVKKLQLYAK